MAEEFNNLCVSAYLPGGVPKVDKPPPPSAGSGVGITEYSIVYTWLSVHGIRY